MRCYSQKMILSKKLWIIKLMNKENFVDYRAVIIAALSLLVVRKTQIHPIWVIVIAGCAGYFIY